MAEFSSTGLEKGPSLINGNGVERVKQYFSISIQINFVYDSSIMYSTCVLYDREVLMDGTADWRNLMRSMALLTILMTLGSILEVYCYKICKDIIVKVILPYLIRPSSYIRPLNVDSRSWNLYNIYIAMCLVTYVFYEIFVNTPHHFNILTETNLNGSDEGRRTRKFVKYHLIL